MEQADFVHLVRISEQDSADNSGKYRRGVAAFAALGYAWVLGCMGVAVALIAWALPNMMAGRWRFGMAWMLLGAAGLLWASLRALWVKLDEPGGVEITALEAPELFDALERIRRKIKGPALHSVTLSDDFNASIQQLPRWGLLGGARNHLTIGLPLLMALDRPRFLAVLAHEYGHLRGNHGRFAAWIYRTRQSWQRLHRNLRGTGTAAQATQAFLGWYFPRFAAKTFALARQDEYEADRIAGRMLGREVAGAALVEIEVRGAWIASTFWHTHWAGAAQNALPVGPYRTLRRMLKAEPDPTFARDALRQALKRPSGLDDTHPSLRDRLEALDAPPLLPDWSRGKALSLLGPDKRRWVDHFDKQWCRANATEWKHQHAWLRQVWTRVQDLVARSGSLSAAELVEQARLTRQLEPRTDLRPLYRRALRLSPDSAAALRGLAECLGQGGVDEREEKMACLESLWNAGGADRWWAARAALAELDTPRPGVEHDAAAYKLWRRRLERAEEAEERAWDELVNTPFFAQTTRHDLSAMELAELRAELARSRAIAACWLVRKSLREFPQRRAYLVFVDLPGMDDADRYAYCRALERGLTLPGPALVLWAGESPTRTDIERHAADPIHTR